MALAPRKRQKKLERRKAKQKEKQRALAERNPRDRAARIKRSATAPILHCCTTDALWEQGVSSVLVSRELKSGNVAFAMFLVDMYCLGVKDAFFDVVPRAVYEKRIYGKLPGKYEMVDLEPETARKLVEGAVEYAGRLGLAPHRDYPKARLIFGDVDAGACTEKFVYGKDGKPLFISGPHDSPSRCHAIITTLSERCGEDGFEYIVSLSALGGPDLDEIDPLEDASDQVT